MSALSLDAAKAHLNLTGTASDTELQSMIDAAEARLSQEVGPLSATTVSKRVATAGFFLLLPIAPAQSLTSVTDVRATTALDLTLLTLDGDAGTVYYSDGMTRFWSPSYDVQYVAGWATVPQDILFAIKEQVRHMWDTQRGSMPLAGPSADYAPPPGNGYALPNSVQEYIAPYRQSVVG